MGIKTRMVPEEYFIMELEDMQKAHENFVNEYNARPSVHIIHPDAKNDLSNELNLKVCIHREFDKIMYYMGVKIITSEDVSYEKIQTY